MNNALSKFLGPAIVTNVNTGLNKVLSTLPMTVKVTPEVELSYALPSSPQFISDYVTVPILGEFYIINNHMEPPFPNPAIPSKITGEQFQIIISEFVPDSAAFSFYKLGKLRAVITDSMVPAWSPVRLNTSAFQDVLPGLYEKWPNKLFQITVEASQSPNVSLSTTGALVMFYGTFKVDVILDSANHLANAFVLGGFITTSGFAYLKETTMYGNLTYINGNFYQVSSNIGDIEVGLLTFFLNMFFSKGLVPLIDVALKYGGIPLPVVNGLSFVNPKIQFGNKFLLVSTNIKYTPPKNIFDPKINVN